MAFAIKWKDKDLYLTKMNLWSYEHPRIKKYKTKDEAENKMVELQSNPNGPGYTVIKGVTPHTYVPSVIPMEVVEI